MVEPIVVVPSVKPVADPKQVREWVEQVRSSLAGRDLIGSDLVAKQKAVQASEAKFAEAERLRVEQQLVAEVRRTAGGPPIDHRNAEIALERCYDDRKREMATLAHNRSVEESLQKRLDDCQAPYDRASKALAVFGLGPTGAAK